MLLGMPRYTSELSRLYLSPFASVNFMPFGWVFILSDLGHVSRVVVGTEGVLVGHKHTFPILSCLARSVTLASLAETFVRLSPTSSAFRTDGNFAFSEAGHNEVVAMRITRARHEVVGDASALLIAPSVDVTTGAPGPALRTIVPSSHRYPEVTLWLN